MWDASEGRRAGVTHSVCADMRCVLTCVCVCVCVGLLHLPCEFLLLLHAFNEAELRFFLGPCFHPILRLHTTTIHPTAPSTCPVYRQLPQLKHRAVERRRRPAR